MSNNSTGVDLGPYSVAIATQELIVRHYSVDSDRRGRASKSSKQLQSHLRAKGTPVSAADNDEMRTLREQRERVGIMLDSCDTYFVSGPICQHIVEASASLPSCQLTADLLPTERGFLYFEQAYQLPESDAYSSGWGRRLASRLVEVYDLPKIDLTVGHSRLLRAIQWNSMPEACLVFTWTDGAGAMPTLLSADIWHFGATWDRQDSETPATDQPLWLATRRAFMTALTFLAQGLAVVTDAQAPRADRKRAKHEGRKEPSIRVVHLRRIIRPERDPDETAETRHVEWKHRWKVRPHWRNQYYASLDRHHPKFIDSYWKGPADMPPLLSKTLFAVTR